MKKFLVRIMVMCAVMSLVCTAALAAFSSISVESAYASSITMEADGDTVKITATGVPADSQVLVLALSSEGVPTADNIVYIDQDSSSETGVNFTIYPNAENLTAGSTYYVYLSSNAASGPVAALEKVGSFVYGASASDQGTKGDVDNNGTVATLDAVWVLQYVVHDRDLDDAAQWRADTNNDGSVGTVDAVKILQYVVHDITSFD